jgi:hypothetical protein
MKNRLFGTSYLVAVDSANNHIVLYLYSAGSITGGKQLPYIPLIKSSSIHSGLIADDRNT